MPTTLQQWYDWAFKLDWQYRQEQAKSKLLHPHLQTSSKFGKSSGSSGKAVTVHEMKAQPLATAVTLPSTQAVQHPRSQHLSDAMDVDRGGRRPPVRCYKCGKLGHISRSCPDTRVIRGAGKDENPSFVEESQ